MESTLILLHNILYSRGYQKAQRSEHYFPDHALGIMLAGESSHYSNEGTFVMNEGTICLMRRNQLFKKLKKPSPTGEPPTLISVFLDQNALHQYATDHAILKQKTYKGQAMIDLSDNEYLKGYFDRLLDIRGK